MRLPRFLQGAIFVLILLAIIALVMSLTGKPKISSHLASFALLLTLAALIIYTWYTYLLAKEAWTPSASIKLQEFKDPYQFRFVLQSYCKLSLECWCKLNASVNEKSLPIGGFYNEQKPFTLQPFGIGGTAVRNLREFVKGAGASVEELERTANDHNQKKQLRFDIEFSYNVWGTTEKKKNPNYPHYFDFRRKMWGFDV